MHVWTDFSKMKNPTGPRKHSFTQRRYCCLFAPTIALSDVR